MEISTNILKKAQKIVDEGNVSKYDESTFYVKGESDTWEVKWDIDIEMAISCGCKWYQIKHNICSHMVSVNLFNKKERKVILWVGKYTFQY